MSQDHETGVMPADPAAVRAACERVEDAIDSQNGWQSAVVAIADLTVLLAALSARDEAREALQTLEKLSTGENIAFVGISTMSMGEDWSVWQHTETPSDVGLIEADTEAEAVTLPEAIQALAAQLSGVVDKQAGEGAAGASEMKEAGEG